jgi:hypothetical protein
MALKRKASFDLSAQKTPTKRNGASSEILQHSCDDDMPRIRGRSRVRGQRRPMRLNPSSLPTPSPEPSADSAGEELFSEEDYDHEIDPLLARIQLGIAYTNSRSEKNLPLMQTTRFVIPRPTATYAPSVRHTYALSILSASSAILVLTSPTHTVYELGMPTPYIVPEGAGVRLVHTPQWWVGKSAAEVKAGPYANEIDIRRAAGNLKGLVTK